MDRANGGGPGAAASRAERFEDEKRRIIESCFSKKDVDGSLIETYITHIRITEYSSHPSSPPPPEVRNPQAEKPRIIIIAVRKSGRVRMHKSKENANGSFSVGKTWNLDDLTHIESYTGPQTSPSHREWAGDTGFLVSLGKPYFWMAQTDKEKKFFIASLIKIYGKYTGGKVPELAGFEQREFDQVMGAGRRQPPPGPNSRPPPPLLQGPSQPHPPPNPPSHPPSQNDSLPNQPSSSSPAPPPSLAASDAPRFGRTPPVRPPPNGTSSPAGSFDSSASRERPERPPPPRWLAQNNRSQDSFVTRSEDASSLPPRSRNGMAGPGAFGRFGEPPESRPPPGPVPTPPQLQPHPPAQEKPPPERRRPPMDPSRPHDRDLVPPPLISPGSKREVVAPPPRSTERSAGRRDSPQQSANTSLSGSVKERERDRETPPPSLRPGPPERHAPPEAARPEPLETPKLFEPPKPPKAFEPPKPFKTPSTTSLPVSTTSSPAPTPALKTEAVSVPPPPPEPPADPEDSRPGLGPMIKSKKSKGEIAGAFWKAASAASAFKPRPGGAGERLRQAVEAQKPEEGPDGITSVIPAPPRPPSRGKREETPPPPPPPERAAERPESKSSERASLVPEVKITVPNSSRPSSFHGGVKEIKKPKDTEKALPRKSALAGNDAKYLQTLGVNPSILDDRSEEFSKWLDYFGWVPGDQMRTRNVEDMKSDLERELNKAQAGGWLARFRDEDERVDAIKSGLDLAMGECEELDNLLTLYSVELSTLSDDIAYIEAQGQGLQVQTANQKLLKKELESLLETCAITQSDLEALRLAPLEHIRGLEDVERSLVTLFKAMSKIDPTLGGNDASKMVDVTMDSDQSSSLNSDYGKMRIVQEKKEMYLQESAIFMRRLVDFMSRQFDESFAETKKALDGALSKKVDATHHDVGRDVLWKYSPLMLFARDADLENWNRMIQVYQEKSHPLYRSEFQNVVTIWRKNARKLKGEEAELLFTFQVEKHQENVATTARKLTVKRSQTLARALRSPLADGGSRTHVDKSSNDSRSLPYEVFTGVVDDLLPLVEMEQNFIIDFFHATTLEQLDFPDAVAARGPKDRRGGDLKRHRLMEPDRELARRVTRSMEVIFAFLDQELQRLMEWVIGQDPLQGVGVLGALEKKMSEMAQSNQDFLNNLLQKLHGFLEGRFKKFVDEQIRAIEETKVKIHKRKGVISFIRVFPAFSTAVENMLAGLDANLAARRTIDREYDRILKTMFDSLMVIARENPTHNVSSGNADPEDKEALNFHILLIENMNHFIEETDTRGLDVLEEWSEQANSTYEEHMDLYLNAVMRRPLGKVLEHLENIEAQLQSGKSASAIAAQPSNSKNIFNKILGNYDSKEVRKGIEALRKRVDKHFGDADDPALSRGLVAKVLRECENFYGTVASRIGAVTTDVYGGDVLFEWPRADVKAAFR
ncbi:Fc.00g113380.m01.CDS01 [Cosmosporella sp. VM-42]